jgi:hypothetical protein
MLKVRLSPDQVRLLTQQEAENRELRAALAALKQQHAEACDRLFALSQAHSGLYLSFTQIASAHATRDRVARNHHPSKTTALLWYLPSKKVTRPPTVTPQ